MYLQIILPWRVKGMVLLAPLNPDGLKSDDKGEDQAEGEHRRNGGNDKHIAHAFAGFALACFFFWQFWISHLLRPVIRARALARTMNCVTDLHLVRLKRL